MANIKQWNADDRPREKMRMKGASHLSDAELIAILIQHGTIGKSALELSMELLNRFNSKPNEIIQNDQLQTEYKSKIRKLVLRKKKSIL